MQLQVIASIRSSYQNKLMTPRQSGLVKESRAVVELLPEFSPAMLDGLEGFSHLWLIFGFHLNSKNSAAPQPVKVRPPRLGKKMGVWATRSPHRPNNLGLSAVKILKIEGRKIVIAGVDIVDGSPIYDIKPYLPVDRLSGLKFGWLQDIENHSSKAQVTWTKSALKDFKLLKLSSRFYRLINRSLEVDPRPLTYESKSKAGNKYIRSSKSMKSLIENIDVEFLSAGQANLTVCSLKRVNEQNHFDRSDLS